MNWRSAIDAFAVALVLSLHLICVVVPKDGELYVTHVELHGERSFRKQMKHMGRAKRFFYEGGIISRIDDHEGSEDSISNAEMVLARRFNIARFDFKVLGKEREIRITMQNTKEEGSHYHVVLYMDKSQCLGIQLIVREGMDFLMKD